MQRNILIVEDNEIHTNALQAIINDLHKDVKVYCANTVEKGYEIALKYQIHLFLIDIILDTHIPGDVSGMDYAEKIRRIEEYKFTPIVFITSLEDSKFYSYNQINCLDYIEKPFSVARVSGTILHALEFPVVEDDDKHVYFRKDGVLYSIYARDIIYIFNSRRKIKIFCVNDNLEIPYKTNKEILEKLNSKSFVECSRRCIVNKKYIKQIDYTNRYIRLENIDEPIEIGATMKKMFKDKMENND